MYQAHGYWWPKAAERTEERYLKHRADADHAIQFCRRRRVAVQAGGHVGLWPLHLARKGFKRIVTFEPCEENLACLQRNIIKTPNIEVYARALGDKAETVGLHYHERNSGGHHIVEGEDGVTMVRLDDQELDYLDLLCLDVEGYELPALQGGEKMIAKHRPVIMLEVNGKGERGGKSPERALWKWFAEHGYTYKGKTAKDQVWTRR